jgi:alpha-L-fucosidase 2
MTSHDLDLRIYYADFACSFPTVLMEMLLFSKPGVIKLLPMLPDALSRGSIFGLRGQCQVVLERLTWDLEQRIVQADIRSLIEQKVILKLGRSFEKMIAYRTCFP